MKNDIKSFWSFRFLLSELVKKGIRLKYRRSYLGIVWSLIEPLLTTIVLVIVFGTLFNTKAETFPLYVITGRLIYTFFSNATKTASKSIRNNAAMIKKVYVPKYLYPLSVVLYNAIIFGISLTVLFLVMAYCRVTPTRYIFQFIPGVLILLLLTIGVSMILTTLNVFFRDMEYIWNVALMLIMYMCAIFYYPERLEASNFAWILKYNPLYCVISINRGAFLGYAVDTWTWGYSLGTSVVLLVLGVLFFKKSQEKFILHI